MEGGARPTTRPTHDRIEIVGCTVPCTVPLTNVDERRTSCGLDPSHKNGGKGRREGERCTKFNQRLKEETRMALLQDRTMAAKLDAQMDSDRVALSKKKERRKVYLDGR